MRKFGLFWHLCLSHLVIALAVLAMVAWGVNTLVERDVTFQNRKLILDLSRRAILHAPLSELDAATEPQAALVAVADGTGLVLPRSVFVALASSGAPAPRLVGDVNESTLPPLFQLENPLPQLFRALAAHQTEQLLRAGRWIENTWQDTPGGDAYRITFLPLGPVRSESYVLMALKPIGMHEQLLQDLGTWFWPMALVVAGVAGLIAWTAAWPMVMRIREIERVALRAAAGDLAQRLPEDAMGELGQATRALNQALDALAATRDRQQQAAASQRAMLGEVSHELRAPLASLRGHLELLQDGVIRPEEQDRYVGTLLEDTFRLSRMAEELLLLARLDAGELLLDISAVDARECCIRVADQFQWQFAGAKKELVVEVPDELPPVRADPDRLHQLLGNLLDNALRYSADGGRVTLAVEPQAEVLRFSVADTGPGIATVHLNRIWDRFYKVDRARTPHRSGTGLGLSIVRQLAEAMGGQVGVSSDTGGTCFWFLLPAASL